MSSVNNHVVVVTGAGGGLGREYSLQLAKRGAKVIVNDLGGARDGSGSGVTMADGVVAEIREAGGVASANYDNVATASGAQSLIQDAVDTFGTVHGVINNAGILRDASFGKLDADDWDSVLKVHLYGSFNVTQAAWPYFRDQEFGRVVMASSTSGLYGNFGQANYGAAKLGLVGLMNTLAIEGSRRNIHINAIAPMAATRMTSDVADEQTLQSLHPSFVAPVVVKLMSDDLDQTGSVFVVGGGLVQRVAFFQNEGVRFSEVPTLEELDDKWEEIINLSDVSTGVNPVGS